MLLSIKAIAALSLVPLSFAKAVYDKTGLCENCNFASPYNRVNGSNATQNIRGSDAAPTAPFADCPTIAGRTGTPVCVTVALLGSTTVKQLAQNNHCPLLSPASQLVADTDIYSCVSYYQTTPALPISCPVGFPIPTCRYCALPDFAPELARDLIYTPPTVFTGTTLATAPAVPFNCGAPKCPRFAPIPNSILGAPVKYARLSAAYCSSAAPIGTTASPYGGVLPNYECLAPLVKAAVNQKFGCFLQENLATETGLPASDWCDAGLVPFCYYEVPKPFSYPLP